MEHTMISESLVVSSDNCDKCQLDTFVVESECSCHLDHSWCEICWAVA